MAAIDATLARVDSNLDQALARLFALIAIPSISTDPAYAPDCQQAAEWLVKELQSLGFDTALHQTQGHPMVVAKARTGRQGAPHLLFYGHYDVQPPDPLDLWETPPFAPRLAETETGKKIIGRGVADDKGQLMTFIEACRAYKETAGQLPCDITILLEGEEESGSASLPAFLSRHRDELAADLVLVCDTSMWDRKTPAITTMLRGLVLEEVVIHAADRDLHSGMFGGAAVNPIHVLSKIIADLHDANHRITLPGFYDGVTELPADVAQQWRHLPQSTDFLGQVGLSEPAGETGRSILEMIWARPTCDVNGIIGGYTGKGSKTVLPAKASAKFSFRLVGQQDPEKIAASFRSFVKTHLPADCHVEFISHGASPAHQLPFSSDALTRAREALTDEWGTETVLAGCGGSIPIVGAFKQDLGMDALMIGFGLDDDRIHSPNEKYELSSFHKGARSWVRVLAALAG
jgi:acetylornithine deacetylase/succinyl-diaminopimelate desuccinylase-like protein